MWEECAQETTTLRLCTHAAARWYSVYATREVTDYIIHLSHGEFMGVNGEALQLHAVYKELYFLLQVT